MPPTARVLACVALSLAAVGAVAARAQEQPVLDRDEAIRASQSAVGRKLPDFTLLDREGRAVTLSSLRGKPLLVSFVYTGCFQACPAATRALDDSVRRLASRFGEDSFRVASIGFNQPADSPQALKAFALQNRIARANWEFLSPPAAAVEPLTRAFGFRYAATPAGFDHVLQVTLVDASGRIVRQVYGETSATELLADDLARLGAGEALAERSLLADIADRVRILCTVYDPKTGTYRVDYSLAWEIAGGLTFIFSMLLYMLNEWRARRREHGHAPRRPRA